MDENSIKYLPITILIINLIFSSDQQIIAAEDARVNDDDSTVKKNFKEFFEMDIYKIRDSYYLICS